MTYTTMPPHTVMMDAFMGSDASFDGIFFTGVRTTGVFCRPQCSARKPRPSNVTFFASPRDALNSGYRPCRRCRPMETPGEKPQWLRVLLEAIDDDPSRRWRDHDLRQLGITPERVRRWFQRNHGMTFHAYSRARRLGSALGRMQEGAEVGRAAFATGFDSLSGFNEAFRRYFGANPTSTAGATVVHVDRIPTPLGPMLAAATDDGLCMLEFVDRRALPTQVERVRSRLTAVFVPGRNHVVERAEAELGAYFAGELQRFGVPLVFAGTPFQREVWAALGDIPYGETRSYGEIAAAVGRPRAVRAVGKANGDNALGVVVPCHRVVGADGRLVGYGGGLWRKKRLLELERAAPKG